MSPTSAICEHEIEKGVQCGKPATVAIKLHQGLLIQMNCRDEDMGYGTASRWIPVCEQHRENYPDYEGITLQRA